MSEPVLYSLAGVVLFSLGVRGFILHGHLLRKILGFNVMGSGIFLLMVSIASRNPEGPPDPVPHALVLTGLVVAVSFTAFALVLTRRIYAETGKTRLPSGESE